MSELEKDAEVVNARDRFPWCGYTCLNSQELQDYIADGNLLEASSSRITKTGEGSVET